MAEVRCRGVWTHGEDITRVERKEKRSERHRWMQRAKERKGCRGREEKER